MPREQASTEPSVGARDGHGGRIVQVAARGLGLAVFTAMVYSLALLDYPLVFGRWEGFATFPVMVGPPPPLTFQINPGGFVYANDQSRYALVDLGYYTAEWLGWSLFAFRLPALIAGAASVMLFLVVVGRAFGFWPAIVGALALALTRFSWCTGTSSS